MSETRSLLILVVLAVLLGAVAIILSLAIPGLMEGDLVVDRYQATLQEDGTFQEIYTYEVKSSGKYRMLYRYWQDPLSSQPLDNPHIQIIDMEKPGGTVGYLKDWSGEVTLYSDDNPEYIRFVEDRAERNEVGIYNPGYFPSGKYTVTYTYLLHPPIEYDAIDAHLNLRLVDEHVPFRELEIRIPERSAREVFPHPPGLSVTREGGWVTISGNAAADEVLGVETLFFAADAQGIPGFFVSVEDVRGKTLAANPFTHRIPLLGAWVLYGGGLLSVVLTPLLLVFLYRKFGREKEYTVPEFLSFCPNPSMKPWAVNLLFKGDAIEFDQDGYYATLLDLHRRKLITIQEKPEGKGITITLNRMESEEPYEQRVLDFLQNVQESGTVDSDLLQQMAVQARSDRTMERKMLSYQQQLSGVTRRSDPRLVSRYIVDGRDHLFPLLFVGISLCAVSVMAVILYPVLSALLVPAIVLWAGMIVQAGVALAFPSTLFGHWKDDRYKEKLEWDAFARFLSDLALIRQYTPSDISMWGEWLVYGTALGVGEKVERAMEALHISLPEAGVPMAMGLRTAFVPVLAFSAPSHGGSGGGFGGGGSFGGGGGFGGGGVGGR
jgi:uncharacterized membrane protein